MSVVKRNFKVRPSKRRRIAAFADATQRSVSEVLHLLIDDVTSGKVDVPESLKRETRSTQVALWDQGGRSTQQVTELAQRLGVSTNDLIEALIDTLPEVPDVR